MKTEAPANDLANPTSPDTGAELAHGRRLSLASGPEGLDRLQISSPSGEVELLVMIGPEGPRLTIRAVDLRLHAERTLSISCNELDVQVAGAAQLRAGADMSISGKDVAIEAPRGEIAIRANDDVDVRGERIKLNCDDPPMPTSWAEYERRARVRGEEP